MCCVEHAFAVVSQLLIIRRCRSGHRSSPQETGGICTACGQGEQPTNDQFALKAAGATRCSECETGQYSEYDPMLRVSHRCVRCEDGMTTVESAAASVDECVCAANKYDSQSIAVIWGHPATFNDSLSRAVMSASDYDIDHGRRCIQVRRSQLPRQQLAGRVRQLCPHTRPQC